MQMLCLWHCEMSKITLNMRHPFVTPETGSSNLAYIEEKAFICQWNLRH